MKTLLISFRILIVFTIITGIIYPLLVTAIAQFIFPDKANGSLVTKNNKLTGSSLIGQHFDSIIYFSSRPSATGYNPIPSGGSNLGPTNPKLKEMVNDRKSHFIVWNQLDSLTADIPSEMLFSSASGLDPHISLKAARLQQNRIANARNLNALQRQRLGKLITEHTEAPQFYWLGDERVNVLLLNLSLDEHFRR